MKKLTEKDILKIYLLLDKLNEIFHDEERTLDQGIISRFADNYYPTIHKLYYETVWNALTVQQRKDILGEDFIEGIYDKDYFILQEYSLEEKDLMKLRDSL
ncbi:MULTISPECIES: hypothetical protein [Rodentibacter]|uniref:Uncharacterized protein n=1 Tax=Rodentibacter genomosp. 2 TaxID=1908266 RepID=A0A1V3JB96_9PAST|nr:MULTISPECIES: hypothetical protein [Pasteurellaceae]MCQ9124041.1 hypothetical protein [Rodentibacter heylii]OOF53939.1 hypothetical protein BKK55_10600 [Rodentibacter genomosp. 2]